MIELINTTPQTVVPAANVLFDDAVVNCKCGAERWRGGSGVITLTRPGRYLVTFSGNLAVPTGGTVGEVSVAIAMGGDVLAGTQMRATPAAAEEYFNVSAQTYVNVYCGCCETVSVRNTGAEAELVDSPNLTAVRVNG